ncbi:PRC-barrel domain-containing protein [Azospirillum sp. RWY-5-1]|uniref:PRC-barrel domain-containing protein n=1 Tax=Azospirillum oleiclasticum TaxID=2735135 RepID=A0ABX2TL31_9PROT|nr:PRC-barrel domain-containing protein [Azospirillum oleiclasticum]NYZ17857.1 PRC-barrel domain-containing protein [Azospirillum oleiclasticum]NYZ25065.1 PRC-barrel domain-containing protein [Azospirillum oleiclasticum]
MRRLMVVGASALLLLGTAGCAQVSEWTGGSTASNPVSRADSTTLAALTPQQMLGKSVIGSDGRTVGEVEDVLLNQNGQAYRLIVSTGQTLGMGGKTVALDAEPLRWASDRNSIVTTEMTSAQIDGLPEFRYDNSMTSLNRQQRTQ